MKTFDSFDSDSVALTTLLTTPTPSLVKTSLKKAITFYERSNTEFHGKDSTMP